MRENRAYKRLKKLYPAAHWQRIETWAGAGVFDINGCYNGIEAWIECKQASKPYKNGLVKPKIRITQIGWEYERRRAGGRTFLALMVGSELYILKGHYIKILMYGITLSSLKAMAINHEEMFK